MFPQILMFTGFPSMKNLLSCFILLAGFVESGFSLFGEQHIITTMSTEPPHLVRTLKHIYYIGTLDNGTLSCKIPGAVSYVWIAISKDEIADGGYVYSWVDKMKLTDPDKPWEMEISQHNFRTSSQVVRCLAKSGYDNKIIAEIVWVVTRLHSPLGYPTDPLVCGGKKRKCEELKRQFRIECSPDSGKSYRGSLSHGIDGTKCSNWNNIIPHDKRYHMGYYKYYAGMENKFCYYAFRGEHNYCRMYVHGGNYEGPLCYKQFSRNREKIQCNVPSCSNCMYGNGDGKLEGYNFQLPKYSGSGVDTLHYYTAGNNRRKYRKCYRDFETKPVPSFWFHENLCRNKLQIRWIKFPKTRRPSCFVYKGSDTREGKVHANEHEIKSRLQLAPCRIRQCTVRIVWFMFFDEHKQLIVDGQSSQEPRKFIFIVGQKAQINYYVFGINLLDGMRIKALKSTDGRLPSKWKNTVRWVPKISTLELGTVTKEVSGGYYFVYTFAEADNTVELGAYSQMFELDIRKPLSISLSPAHVHICELDKGTVHLKIIGDFEVQVGDITWSYSLHKKLKPIAVSFDVTFIKISNDGKSATVSQPGYIFVAVRWPHGVLKAEAKVTAIGKPILQNISPLLALVKPGVPIKLAVATNSADNKLTWIHDAQQIEEVPDDPNMGFSRIKTTKEVFHALVIDIVQDKHYGVYTVTAVNKKKCQHTMEFILRKPSTRKRFDDQVVDDIRPTQISLTNKSIAQFKVVMDFMKQDCSEIVGFPKQLETDNSIDEGTHESSGNETDGDWSNQIEHLNFSEAAEGVSHRRKRNAPIDVQELFLATEPYCIYLQLPKPYFEVNLGSFTRIKGISLLKPPEEHEDWSLFDGTYRLMYSIDGCRWKIYGKKSYRTPIAKNFSNISDELNRTTTTNSVPNLVTKFQARFKTAHFNSDDNITWIGNKSLIFAKHLRLVPTAIGSRNKTCINLNIYGCSASIFETKKKKVAQAQPSGSGSVFGTIAAITGGILGTCSLIVGILLLVRLWQKKRRKDARRKKKERSKSISSNNDSDSESEYESTYSDLSEEHFYWTIPYLLETSKSISSNNDSGSESEYESTYPDLSEEHFYSTIPSLLETSKSISSNNDSDSKSEYESTYPDLSEEHFYSTIPYLSETDRPEVSYQREAEVSYDRQQCRNSFFIKKNYENDEPSCD